MNELLKTRLFNLLTESSQEVANKEIQIAYGSFKKRVEAVSQSEKNYSYIYRILSDTRIELASIESLHRYGQGGKCA